MKRWIDKSRILPKRWSRLRWRDQLLLVEAVVLLGLARATILLIPFKRIAPHLGETQQETAPGTANAAASHIAHAIRLASRHTPWSSNCFAQALAAHLMLRRRGAANTLYLGIYKDMTSFAAHAWLRNGDPIVTGAPEHKRFMVIARYSWQAKP
jgi:hypothetical protein